LTKCCSEYLHLFYGNNGGNNDNQVDRNKFNYNDDYDDDKDNNSTLISLLLSWMKTEMNNFTILFINKIKEITSEVTLIIINQLRKTTIGIQIPSVSGSLSGSISGLSGSGLSGSGSVKIMKSSSIIIDKGPLYYTSIYINTAFVSLHQIDGLGLNGHVTFAWLLLLYIKQIISDYCDSFHKEIILEVRQDNWIFFEMNNISIKKSVTNGEYLFDHNNNTNTINSNDNNHHNTDNYDNANDNFLASSSYAWMNATVGHYIGEIWLLIRGGHMGEGKDMSYSRYDLCEVEPTAVACILRLCIRYLLGIYSYISVYQILFHILHCFVFFIFR
jgi:hypothetical protein